MKQKIFFLILVLLIGPCCGCAAESALAASNAEAVLQFATLDSINGLAKAAPGNLYELGEEDLPGSYTYTEADGVGTLTCKGLTFTIKVRNRGLELVLPGGQTLSGGQVYEVTTTSCHFQVTRQLGVTETQYQLIVYK